MCHCSPARAPLCPARSHFLFAGERLQAAVAARVRIAAESDAGPPFSGPLHHYTTTSRWANITRPPLNAILPNPHTPPFRAGA